MKLEVIKSQIDKFLASGEPGVLAIKGTWGVGKTFAWNKFLLDAKNENRVCLKKYSYISLFGINSLDVFKYSIFENVIDRNIIGTDANVDTFKKNTADLLASLGRKTVKLVKGASLLKDFVPAIESFSFLSLEKHLICIDDLERRGENLSAKDILGLVSLLKEQKKCQVVILLNDGEDGLEDYEKYREKVIDIELAFEPEPIESASIVFLPDTPQYLRLRELTTSLGIRNIRILKKIERIIDLLLPLTDGFESELIDQVLHSTVLFTWSHYSNSNIEIPSLEFITQNKQMLMAFGEDEETEQERSWRTTLQSYNYQHSDGLDLILVEVVKFGYVQESAFIEKASIRNKEIIMTKAAGSFSKAWELYHYTLDNNGDEVVREIYESFKRNCQFITPYELNNTILLFKDLGEVDKALEILNVYIHERKGEVDLFDVREVDIFGGVVDEDLANRFDEIHKRSVTIENAKQVLERIASINGWNPNDLVVLANTSVDEYYSLFKTETGRHLSSYITKCLKFGQFVNANEQQMEIAKRAEEALKRIASESEINKKRVKKFGVSI